MSGIGYRQVGQHLRGDISLQEAAQLIGRHTRRLVRQQSTWFRHDDPAILWFDLDTTTFDQVVDSIARWLGGSGGLLK